MKKLLTFILTLASILTLSCSVLAEAPLELTQEYIDMYGIPSVDEYGNHTILIQLTDTLELTSISTCAG